MNRFWQRIVGQSRGDGLCRLGLIVMVGVVVYAGTLTFPFAFDDMVQITGSNQVRNLNLPMSLSFWRQGRALGVLSFALNYRLHGEWVVGYHLVNVAIHLLSTIALYNLILLLWRTPLVSSVAAPSLAGHGRAVAFFAALLFVVHPLQTQAVTYVAQRFTSLATLFYLVSVVCYIRARLAPDDANRRRGRQAWYFMLSFGAALLAMRTKEISLTLPLVLVSLELLCFRGRLRSRVLILSVFLLTMAVIPLSLIGVRGGVTEFLAAADRVTRIQTAIPRVDYLLTQFRVVATYLRLLALPVNQNLDYDVALSHSIAEPAVLGALALHLLLIAIACWCVFRSRPSSAPTFLPRPHLRLVAIGIGWFYLTLLVESSFMPIIDLLVEHRVYLPSAGAFMAVGAVVAGLAGTEERPARAGLWAAVLLAGISLVLAVATIKRNQVWRDEVTLWEDVTRKSPNLSRPWNNLGYAYLKRKDPARALPALVRSLSIDPGFPDAWNNVGLALTQLGSYLGRFDRTVEMFRDLSSVKAEAQATWFAKAYNNLGLAYDYLGRPEDALTNFRKSLDMDADYAAAHYNMGMACLKTGKQACVIDQYLSLVQLRSGFAPMLRARMPQ